MTDPVKLVPTMRLRWAIRYVEVPRPEIGGGTVKLPQKTLQQWHEAPADAAAVGPPPGEWRDVPYEDAT